LAGVCAGIKRSGGRCTATVGPGEDYCYHHDPARAGERRRAASRAGKGKLAREIVGIKALLSDLAERVLSGEVETGRAAVANQLTNTRLRTLEIERKIRESDEMEARIEELERAAEEGDRKGGHRGWGA
jgi:hypothetical protein